jgi:hypothetical protein
MPLTLERVKYWLKLLLDLQTPLKQAKVLLKTASPHQLLALKEILYNIVHNKDLEFIKLKNKQSKYKRWDKLSNTRKKLKIKHISKYIGDILKLLHSYRELILGILKHHE